jgi:hypothetical protein
MYWKVALILSVALVLACKPKEELDGEAIATENTMCLNYPKPADFLPKARKGDFDAMITAQHYYSTCALEKIDPKEDLYWTKQLSDSDEYKIDGDGVRTDSYDYVRMMSNLAAWQIDPTNEDKIPNLTLDPLLIWIWKNKSCELAERQKPEDRVPDDCEPMTPPDWLSKAEWQKIINSPPTVKDRIWYQYLPKGCEQGECLPK